MTDSAVAFLGVIAAATAAIALVQVGAVVYAARIARRIEALAARLERDVQPMIERLTAMSGEAARATTLAAQQVERVDRTLTLLGARVDRAVDGAQRALVRPAREGAALAAAVRAAVVTLRALRKRRREASLPGADDDDALFIG